MATTFKTPASFDDLPNDAFVRERTLLEQVLPFSKQTLWRRIKDGTFPPPKKFGAVTAWQVGLVRAYLAGLWTSDYCH
jgi:predicted DNA-binding transcriptional regulator AlpA